MHELSLPDGVTPKGVMHALQIGHGYSWLVILRRPYLLVHGSPPGGDMPEVLLSSTGYLVLEGGDPSYVARMRRMLEVLATSGGGR